MQQLAKKLEGGMHVSASVTHLSNTRRERKKTHPSSALFGISWYSAVNEAGWVLATRSAAFLKSVKCLREICTQLIWGKKCSEGKTRQDVAATAAGSSTNQCSASRKEAGTSPPGIFFLNCCYVYCSLVYSLNKKYVQ